MLIFLSFVLISSLEKGINSIGRMSNISDRFDTGHVEYAKIRSLVAVKVY